MLDCTITCVRQDMDLERNVTTNFLVLRLPDGKLLRVAIDDAAAATVVALSIAQRGEPTAALPAMETEQEQDDRPPQPQQSLPPPAQDENFNDIYTPPEDAGVRIFGGQDGGSEVSQDYAAPPAPAPPAAPPARPNVQILPNGKVIVPSRTVPRNEFGYPIANPNGVDVGRITTRNNQDEDGVGSV